MEKLFISIAIIKAKTGKAEALKQELLKLINPTRIEEGCLEYILFEDEDVPGTFYMRETFVNQHAFEVHVQTAHFLNFSSQLDSLADGGVKPIKLVQISH
ncbi:putative quinol monooxygenase [Chryseobacterium sp. OSA05B]|uniref:putative quinol monooxygenase n=1 Tax=Chryseobacterium sp. OSA05B TaxID=2862650 RepID=UPI001CC12CFE|nr:putative quinol monooxygenase [Chryseobacterium sp. OSA05B]